MKRALLILALALVGCGGESEEQKIREAVAAYEPTPNPVGTGVAEVDLIYVGSDEEFIEVDGDTAQAFLDGEFRQLRKVDDTWIVTR